MRDESFWLLVEKVSCKIPTSAWGKPISVQFQKYTLGLLFFLKHFRPDNFISQFVSGIIVFQSFYQSLHIQPNISGRKVWRSTSPE